MDSLTLTFLLIIAQLDPRYTDQVGEQICTIELNQWPRNVLHILYCRLGYELYTHDHYWEVQKIASKVHEQLFPLLPYKPEK